MKEMNKQEDFFKAVELLIKESEIKIDRPKNSAHPTYPDKIYPVDYGYLVDTASIDSEGIDIWCGSGNHGVDAVICTVDLFKRDSEIKILFNCTRDEKEEIFAFHNDSQMMKGVLIERYLEVEDDEN